MALRAVTDHPKFAQLMSLLGLTRYQALGCLECVWHFASNYTPSGNIGRYSDAAIEAWIGWDGSPGTLIAALIESGWLNQHSEFRIVLAHVGRPDFYSGRPDLAVAVDITEACQ